MAKYSYDRGDHWDVAFWLAFDAWGSVRLSRGEPDLKRGERAMSITAKVPHSLFSKPTLRATLNIEAPAPQDQVIDFTAAAVALKEALGVDIDVRVEQPPQP